MKHGFKAGVSVLLLGLAMAAQAAAQETAKDHAVAAYARLSLGDLDGCIAECTRAIALDPDYSTPYYNRGLAESMKGSSDAAIADFNHAIKLDPQNADAFNDRGIEEAKKGDFKAAVADYDTAIGINPEHMAAYCNRGLAKVASGDPDGAIEDYNQALLLSPKEIRVWENRGLAKESKGYLDGAIADFTHSIALAPDVAPGYSMRGRAKSMKDDLDGAFADDSHAIELDPQDAPTYQNRGLVNAFKRNWKDALADFRRFHELSGNHGGDRDYTLLYAWVIRARLDETADADKELSSYMDKRTAATKGDWFSKLAGFLLGSVNEADLLAAAASPDAKKDKDQHCEAWFFAGMKKLLSGDKKTAIDYFHKCLATEKSDNIEYHMAQYELKALGE